MFVNATKIRWVLEAYHGGDSVGVVCHLISRHPLISSPLTASRKRWRFYSSIFMNEEGPSLIVCLSCIYFPECFSAFHWDMVRGWVQGHPKASCITSVFGVLLFFCRAVKVCYFENTPPGNNMLLVPVCSVHQKNMP